MADTITEGASWLLDASTYSGITDTELACPSGTLGSGASNTLTLTLTFTGTDFSEVSSIMDATVVHSVGAPDHSISLVRSGLSTIGNAWLADSTKTESSTSLEYALEFRRMSGANLTITQDSITDIEGDLVTPGDDDMASQDVYVMGPLKVYKGAADATRPDVGTDTVPTATWTEIADVRNQGEAGVVITSEHTFTQIRSGGSTGLRGVRRTASDLMVSVAVKDLSVNVLELIFDEDKASTAAATNVAGQDQIEMHADSFDPKTFAILVRGNSGSPESAESAGHNIQFWSPKMYTQGRGTMSFVAGAPAEPVIVFQAIQDDTHGYGKVDVQTADQG